MHKKLHAGRESSSGDTESTDLLLNTAVQSDLTQSQAHPKLRGRLTFLDSFRGICITIMVFVNYGGGQYWYFRHSAWNGLTVADLVFPWFMYIMGTSMALSFESQLQKGISKLSMLQKVVRRAFLLLILGVFVVNHNYNLKTFRFLGVLQRFAVAYLVVGVLRILTLVSADTICQRQRETGGWRRHFSFVYDITQYWIDWLAVGTFSGIYLALSLLLFVPGCPRGYLGAGGLADGARHGNCTGGAAGYIDKLVFGKDHIYNHPTCKNLYNTSEPFDPEGLLGSLMSILDVFLGLQAGQIFIVYRKFSSRLGRLLSWALLYGSIGGLLCNFSQNDGWIPINKNLWSPSFVLVLACMANLILLVLYYIIDEKAWWKGQPFCFIGMNSIAIYLGHELLHHEFPFSWTPVHRSHAAHLFMNLWATSLWLMIAYYLHYMKFYLSV